VDSNVRRDNAWANAPFDAALLERVRALANSLDVQQRLWLSGYLAGTAEAVGITAAAPVNAAAITILYGSQSGNSERVAHLLGEKLAQQHVGYTLLDMLDCRKSHLEAAQTLCVVVSTQGDGVPPDRALPLHELLHGRKAPRLEHLSYSVLALGDSSYEHFCATGKEFDARLEALGAKRLLACEACDVDFEPAAVKWIDALAGKLGAAAPRSIVAVGAEAEPRSASVSIAHTRRSPFDAPVLANQRITARGASKDVRHVEIALDGSHIRYEPGDAIGIVPKNPAAEVDAVIAATGYDAEAPVTVDTHSLPLRQALTECFELGEVTASFLERYAAATAPTLGREACERHLIDVVREHPPSALSAEQFVRLLRPLAPRLYSIASSQRATPDEAHLTVSIVEYATLGIGRRGVVSGTIADLDDDEATLPVYLHRNTGFRLPQDPHARVIMIGPGTGVAPFRAFLAEREALDAPGENWLFFGDRSFDNEFLYQTEWLDWRKRGVLTRLDVAFSRDQAEKCYVQHRLREHGAHVWDWMEQGAHLYVCGDAKRMAPDVQAALLDIARNHGGLGDDDAAEWLTNLQRQRRYQRDVY
jgi:sulfite reductase (NADPH) flavoprotein alpha-component